MITSQFSVIHNILKVDEQYRTFIADPEDFFMITFNGESVYSIDNTITESLYGQLLMCWGEGIHNLYILLINNKLIRIDQNDHVLCKYLIEHHDLIKGLDDLDLIKEFALL